MLTEFVLLTLLMSPVMAFIAGVIIVSTIESLRKSPRHTSCRDGL